MLAAWAFQRARNNGGWTDVFWTFGVGTIAAAAALWPVLRGEPTSRQRLAALMVLAWSARLGLHILRRVATSPEDARYVELRARFGAGFQRWMALFLPFQALVSLPLLGSVVLAAHAPEPALGALDVLAAAVLAVSVLGEGLADRQLARFKSDPANHGGVCEMGLWAWSRHPNYFFEWLAWTAWPIMALGGGWATGAMALAGPCVMYLILRFGTGVPLLEAHMRRSRGAAFEAYALRTSAFFPRPPSSPAKTTGARP
jgi:steroid 5-alpha reductase family enzyme